MQPARAKQAAETILNTAGERDSIDFRIRVRFFHVEKKKFVQNPRADVNMYPLSNTAAQDLSPPSRGIRVKFVQIAPWSGKNMYPLSNQEKAEHGNRSRSHLPVKAATLFSSEQHRTEQVTARYQGLVGNIEEVDSHVLLRGTVTKRDCQIREHV